MLLAIDMDGPHHGSTIPSVRDFIHSYGSREICGSLVEAVGLGTSKGLHFCSLQQHACGVSGSEADGWSHLYSAPRKYIRYGVCIYSVSCWEQIRCRPPKPRCATDRVDKP